MNNLRRKELTRAIGVINEALDAKASGDRDVLEFCLQTALALLLNARDDEKRALFNMPRNFRSCDTQTVNNIDQALSILDAISSSLEMLTGDLNNAALETILRNAISKLVWLGGEA